MQHPETTKLPTVAQIAFPKFDTQYIVPDPIIDLAIKMEPSSEKSLLLKKLLVIHRVTENIKTFCETNRIGQLDKSRSEAQR